MAVLRGDTVLLASRTAPPYAGVFTLPGGRVEPGETLAEAALRELGEEVGLRAAMLGFVAPVEIVVRNEAGLLTGHFVVMAHAARWIGGEPRTGPECGEARWIREDELGGLPTTPGLAGIVRAAFALRAAADRPVGGGR